MNNIKVAYKKMFLAFTNVNKSKTYLTMVEYNFTTFKALLHNLMFSCHMRVYDSTNILLKTIVKSMYYLNSQTRRVWDSYLYI